MKDAIAGESFIQDQTDNHLESKRSKPAGACWRSGNRYDILDG